MTTDRVNQSRWLHYTIVLVVFAVTGSIAVTLSKLVLGDVFGLHGNLWSGPWSFRVAYLFTIPPSYSLTLVGVGTLVGKRQYFSRRAMRVWGPVLRLIAKAPRPVLAARRRDR